LAVKHPERDGFCVAFNGEAEGFLLFDRKVAGE